MELKSQSQLNLISQCDEHKSKININRKVSKQTLQDVKRLEKIIIQSMSKQEVLDKLHVKLTEKQKLEDELARKELKFTNDAHYHYMNDTLGKVCDEVARLEDTLDKTQKSIAAELECLNSNSWSEIDEIKHKLKEQEDENYELLKKNRTLMEENENLRDDVARMNKQHVAEIEANKFHYIEDYKCLHDRIGENLESNQENVKKIKELGEVIKNLSNRLVVMQKEHAAKVKKLKFQHESEFETLRHDSNMLHSQKQRKIDELNDEIKSANDSFAKTQEDNLLQMDKIKQKYEEDYEIIRQALQAHKNLENEQLQYIGNLNQVIADLNNNFVEVKKVNEADTHLIKRHEEENANWSNRLRIQEALNAVHAKTIETLNETVEKLRSELISVCLSQIKKQTQDAETQIDEVQPTLLRKILINYKYFFSRPKLSIDASFQTQRKTLTWFKPKTVSLYSFSSNVKSQYKETLLTLTRYSLLFMILVRPEDWSYSIKKQLLGNDYF